MFCFGEFIIGNEIYNFKNEVIRRKLKKKRLKLKIVVFEIREGKF